MLIALAEMVYALTILGIGEDLPEFAGHTTIPGVNRISASPR
jgi:hypothetical protein